MNQTSSSVERFFHSFALNSAAAETDAVTAQFADVFIAANPAGAQAVRACDFALAVLKRKQLFESLGRRSTTLDMLHQTPLCDRFVMADTRWRMSFDSAQGNREDVLAESVFILDTGAEPFKIVFYLARQDIFAVLRSREILSVVKGTPGGQDGSQGQRIIAADE